MKKLLRILAIILLSVLVAVLIFAAISIAPVDRTPAQQLPQYDTMMRRLDQLNVAASADTSGFWVGFSKVNLTPPFETATAGYGNRRGKSFTAVHDSIYVRTLVVQQGAQRVAIVSADLLIVPPVVTQRLPAKLEAIGFNLDNVYLGATHSHNSMGNWGEGATRFLYGPFRDTVVSFIVDKIVESIKLASVNTLPATLKTGAMDVGDAVNNRLVKNGPEDPFLRVLEIERSDSTRLALLSFTAHATCLFSRNLELSRDYPGKLVDTIEQNGYAFAMFMAGAVGSHKCDSGNTEGWECIDEMTKRISDQFMTARHTLQPVADSGLVMQRVPLALGDPQVKIARDWKVRAWLFRSAFGEYPVYLSACRIGNLVMLSTPCDYSGEFNAELDSLGAQHGLHVMVTSFNGGYMGYVTPQRYYDVDHYETRLMNWYAPGTGEYMQACLKKMLMTIRQ